MPNPAIAGPVLTAGLRGDFRDVYDKTYDDVKSQLGPVMEMDIPSNKLTEIYGYWESSTYPERWPRGMPIAEKAIRARQFTITNKDWGKRISWHENDRQDDQTQGLYDRARDLGEHFSTLAERVFFQILTATTDATLLDAIPNAADGAALYSSTDGDGGNRFGVSGGNILTGQVFTSGQSVRNAFWGGIQRLRSLQDTEGQPLWGERIFQQGVTIFFPISMWQAMSEAFIQARTAQVIQNVAAAENVAAAAVTNVVLDAGMKVTLVPSQRITASTAIYLFLNGAKRKAIFRQVRMPVRDAFATMDTSDSTRDTKVEYQQWDCREGYGVVIPYQTVKITT